MTEDEAKTKWCPQAINTIEEYGSYNRKAYTGPDCGGAAVDCLCIASECMWWVWEVRRNTEGVQLNWTHGHCGAVKS